VNVSQHHYSGQRCLQSSVCRRTEILFARYVPDRTGFIEPATYDVDSRTPSQRKKFLEHPRPFGKPAISRRASHPTLSWARNAKPAVKRADRKRSRCLTAGVRRNGQQRAVFAPAPPAGLARQLCLPLREAILKPAFCSEHLLRTAGQLAKPFAMTTFAVISQQLGDTQPSAA
jgi:hypothetical protein